MQHLGSYLDECENMKILLLRMELYHLYHRRSKDAATQTAFRRMISAQTRQDLPQAL